MIEALRAGVSVRDDELDALYPASVRDASYRFWTPVKVALRAARLLVVDTRTRVLDVGSGAGKLCIVGALSTGASFTGVEQRPSLVDAARDCAFKMGASGATFHVGRFDATAWSDFDAFYLFNPFHVLPVIDSPDGTVELSRQRYMADVDQAEQMLEAAAIGTRVVTYHGFGGDMPEAYELAHSEPHADDHLKLWIKRV